jgi:hypothetical protein
MSEIANPLALQDACRVARRRPRGAHLNKRAYLQQLGRTTRRLAWSGMAETACYSSNTFCGPIQGEMKAKADIKQTRIYGLATGAATVAFQIGLNLLYRLGLVQLSHQSLRTFLMSSYAVSVSSSAESIADSFVLAATTMPIKAARTQVPDQPCLIY